MVVTVCGRARCGSSMVAPGRGWPLLGDPRHVPGRTSGPESGGWAGGHPGEGKGRAAGAGREAHRGRLPRPDLSPRGSRGARQPPLLGARALARPRGRRGGGDRARRGHRAAQAGGGGREQGRGRGEGRARGARGRNRAAEEPRAGDRLTCCWGQRGREGAGPSRAQGRRAGRAEEGARGPRRLLRPPPARASARLRLPPAAATADLSPYT